MFLGKPHSFRNTQNLEKSITALICLEAFGFAELDCERSVGQKEPWHQPKFPTKRKGAVPLLNFFEDWMTKQEDPCWGEEGAKRQLPFGGLREGALQIPDGRVAPSLLLSQLLRNTHLSLILQIFIVWVNVPGIALSTSYGEVKRQLIKITAIMELTL